MPVEISDDLVNRVESSSTLVRFEDATDANTPRLNYAVPLPDSFMGKLFIETNYHNDEIPWTRAAREDRRLSGHINDFVASLERRDATAFPAIREIAIVPVADEPRRIVDPIRYRLRSTTGLSGALSQPVAERPEARSAVGRVSSFAIADLGERPDVNAIRNLALDFDGLEVGFDQIVAAARDGKAPVFYRTFGGTPKFDLVTEGNGPEEANPRFLIIEHYRLSSFFGDYGAGKTVGVCSLMPGEETTLYIRNWRRSEQTIKQASSIFDSHTQEAADEFESDLLSETTNSSSESEANTFNSKYSHSGGINIGVIKAGHDISFSGEREVQSARESASKNVAKVTTNHSSKASSKRETEVTQEIEQSDAQEFETISERKIKNTNLSRTLNIVTRELNQEFTTYFALVDVTVAFVNDLNVFEVFQVHELDQMIERYIEETTTGPGAVVDPSSPFGAQSPRTFVRTHLLRQLNEVYDFQGTQHNFLEEVSLGESGEIVFPVGAAPSNLDTYYRVRRARRADAPNPFYDPGFVPVEGVVMSETRNTVRTPAVIIDSLLGHGVALDNYALGMQQETLRREQNENRKTEVALDLIQNGDEARIEAFRSLFGSVDADLLREVALRGADDE
jgi:hypothetical protein